MDLIGPRNDNAGGQPGVVGKAKEPHFNFISTSVWRLGYSLQEARRSHEANGRLLTGGLHHV